MSEGTDRLDKLRGAIGDVRARRGPVPVERWLMFGGAVMSVTGILMILLGWSGAAATPYSFEQIPYMISGGLGGVALAILGGLLYFAYWLTRLVQETKAVGQRLAEALDRLEGIGAAVNGHAPAPASLPNGVFVATARGTMFHRPDCTVVEGRSDVRTVDPGDDAFTPCKICDPLATVAG